MGVVAARVGGNPPAGELRSGGFVGAEADKLVGNPGDGCRAAGCANGVQDELPLALIKEQAEGEVAAEERRENGEADGLGEPDGVDDIRWSRLWWRALVWLGSGARHRSFCVDFSILRLAPVSRSYKERI